MAPKTTLAAENLVRLGAERLADILLELAGEHPAIKRRLRLELAGEAGGEAIAAEVAKRITALRSARTFIDWQKRPDFVRDLDLTRAMIADRVGRTRPDLALDLMWRFMALAEPVLNRVDDSSGSVGDVFRAACGDLGTLAARARPDPHALAERVFAAVTTNEYGEFDRLVPIVFPALGETGVAALRARLAAALPNRPATGRYDGRAAAVRRALQDLADGEGDVDAYTALVPGDERKRTAAAAAIGRRLLDAGRAEEAVAALEAGADSFGSTGRRNACLRRSQRVVKCLCRRPPAQRLARPRVERRGNRRERVPAVRAQVGALREVLPQQPVGVLVRAALPRAVRIAEVHPHARVDPQLRMLRHLCPLIPSQRPPQLLLSCTRFPWTSICMTGDRHDEVQHGSERSR